MPETAGLPAPVEQDNNRKVISRILEKQKDPLPSYARGVEGQGRRVQTMYHRSPPGVLIESGEWGAPKFKLLRPMEGKVTTYDEGGDGGEPNTDRLLEFARELPDAKRVHAKSYLTTIKETISADKARTPYNDALQDGEEWHRKNMTSGNPKIHYLIDGADNGRTLIVEEFPTDPTKTADELLEETPRLKSYVEKGGRYFKALGEMTEDDLHFYEKTLDAYREVTKPPMTIGGAAKELARRLRKKTETPRQKIIELATRRIRKSEATDNTDQKAA